MSEVVEEIRHVCALGAVQTVNAIHRAVPIIHAGPGCGQKLWSALSNANGFQGSGYAGGHATPCSNCSEREIIFGGEERLRQTIARTLEVMDGDLFVVLTGCTSDIVGDDVAEVTRSFRSSGKALVFAETGGFKGDNYLGHELLWEALIDQYLVPRGRLTRVPGLVNLWSVVPYQDPFWAGTIQALSELLRGLGLTPNVVYQPVGGIAALQRVPAAELNLLVSPWVGLGTVRKLEGEFGTPYLHLPALPIGPTETNRFLRSVASRLAVPDARVEAFIQGEEARYFYYMERSADLFFETRFLPGRFVTVADSFYALGLTRFLANDLGLVPELQIVTEPVPLDQRPALEAELGRFEEPGLKTRVAFAANGVTVREALASCRFHERPLILGSAWDRAIARELGGYQLSVALPASDRVVLDRTYAGYSGALRLIEDVYSVILSSFQ